MLSACDAAASESHECASCPSNWKDTNGNTCAAYKKQSLCTPTGGFGKLWRKSDGVFSDYSVGGVGAHQVCCECGGGFNAATETCTVAPTPAPTKKPAAKVPTGTPGIKNPTVAPSSYTTMGKDTCCRFNTTMSYVDGFEKELFHVTAAQCKVHCNADPKYAGPHLRLDTRIHRLSPSDAVSITTVGESRSDCGSTGPHGACSGHRCVAVEVKINLECEIWYNTPLEKKVVMPKKSKTTGPHAPDRLTVRARRRDCARSQSASTIAYFNSPV